ncbi:coiled-coil domain-containing protein 81-like isoform 2-T4 [Morphnus guianensis]
MAKDLFLRPHLSPTTEKLKSTEFLKIWASTSCYLSQRLALHQAVRIPGLGTFVVVRERVVSKEKDPVVVERPVFHLANAIARDHGLRYGCIDVPGHQHFEQLPYAQIASENAVSEGTVQLCVERTMCLFRVCLENRDNVALVWRDVGMLIIQGRDVKMRFYTDFLKRLNGTDQMLQAALEMPEMRDSVISRHDTAASQTSSGRVIVLPGYKLETVPKMPTVKADLTGHVKATPEKGWGKGDGSGKKGKGPAGCWQGAGGFPSSAPGGD